MSDVAARLRELIAQREAGDWRDASLVGELLDRVSHEIAAVLDVLAEETVACPFCGRTVGHNGVCRLDALSRAIAAQLDEQP